MQKWAVMLTVADRETLEQNLRHLATRGDFQSVATRVIEEYGPEIYGYLIAAGPGESEADEAFSAFAEDLWRGVSGFRWESSMRTWAYTLAKNALWRHLRAIRRLANVPLSSAPEVMEVPQRLRTCTQKYMRTEVKDQFAELRKQLDPEDQTLLVLRVSREMSWNEIARIISPDVVEGDGDALRREAARLRKRFERIKLELAELARARGIHA